MGRTFRGQTHKGVGQKHRGRKHKRATHGEDGHTRGLNRGGWTLKRDVKIVGGDSHTKDLYFGDGEKDG